MYNLRFSGLLARVLGGVTAAMYHHIALNGHIFFVRFQLDSKIMGAAILGNQPNGVCKNEFYWLQHYPREGCRY